MEHFIQTRKNILNLVTRFDIEALNFIPEGFNNNLIWNFGHIIVTQQLLCYRLAGLPTYVSEEMINEFRKGTKPARLYGIDEFDQLVDLGNRVITHLEKDIAAKKFGIYKPYSTSYGVTLNSFEEAHQFNNIHEAMHLGVMLAMRKLVD